MQKLIQPTDSHGWGRNGRIKIGEIEMFRYTEDVNGEKAEFVHVNITSTRPGKTPPIQLHMHPEDAKAFAKALVKLASPELKTLTGDILIPWASREGDNLLITTEIERRPGDFIQYYLTPCEWNEAIDLLSKGKVIAAVKHIRTVTGCGLRESKWFVDKVRGENLNDNIQNKRYPTHIDAQV